mmetsp:Transcript_4894/g.6720  ORF Transcript_4894/g.6720 Transcript_4894/m.6720 type:complete len:88 (-) Transcript_4894:2937-3200(-)
MGLSRLQERRGLRAGSKPLERERGRLSGDIPNSCPLGFWGNASPRGHFSISSIDLDLGVEDRPLLSDLPFFPLGGEDPVRLSGFSEL